VLDLARVSSLVSFEIEKHMTFPMGQCLSCLGLGRENDESSETQHLLNPNEPNSMQYGATGGADHRGSGSYIDPEDLRKQRERLARLVRQANERLIHIVSDNTPSTRGPIIAGRSVPSAGQPSSMPGMVKLSRDDRNLFEEVAFGDVLRPEEQQSVGQLGCINVPVVASNHLLDADEDTTPTSRFKGERGVIRRFIDLPSTGGN